MEANLFKIVEKLTIKNNLRINSKELHLQLTSHPSYPSLHSVTGVLTHFKIENLALQLPTDLDTFNQLPDVFIACIQINEIDELVLVEKKAKGVKITGEKADRMTVDAFLKTWTGVTLAIDKSEHQSFSNDTFASRITPIFGWLLILSTILFIYLSIDGNFAQSQFLLSVIGTFLSIMIVNHELGNQSTITSKICQISPKVNCDEVINSDFGNISKNIKISDLSVIYFSTLILLMVSTLLLGYNSDNIIKSITIFSIVAVPVSLYYQLKVIKKICSLCLSIAFILSVQTIISIFRLNLNNVFNINAISLVTLVIGLFISAYIWSLIKTQLKLRSDFIKQKLGHIKFKRNYTLFDSLHKAQKSLSSSEIIEGEVVLGNKFAPIHLILITSPLCLHCRDAHHSISNLLSQHADNIRLSIRINVRPSQNKHDLYRIASILIQMNKEYGPSKCLEALHYLYTPNANIQKWLSKNNRLFSTTNDYILNVQNTWCESNNINFTPALYLNGRLFPGEYDIEDLGYFIEDFEEQNESQNQIGFTAELVH